MINWKNLEKFIAPGKVVTLVLLVDGEEVGAFSFNVDSLAFKEALEAASHLDPVKVAEKKSEPVTAAQKKFDKQADKALGKTKSEPKPEPEPMDEEEDEEPEEDDNDIDKVFIESEKEAKEKFAPTLEKLADKPMTREQIMAQSEPQGGSVSSGPTKVPAEVSANEHSGSKSAEQIDKGPQQFKLTDEW